ncbi:hypothetical protein GOODEAATRI_009722 [Goodea atripinnis]|uniref:Uncharacterized protein n=1 Tax=Goodea atripinnis TaxID=208336 RepID=A0ABV0N9B8_9TELE
MQNKGPHSHSSTEGQLDASAPASTKGQLDALASVSTEGLFKVSAPAFASTEGLLDASAPASASIKGQCGVSALPDQPPSPHCLIQTSQPSHCSRLLFLVP